jgi:hypothetical protein
MKKYTLLSLFVFSYLLSNAQEIIKVGDETTIKCTGSLIAEVQNYYLNGTPSSKSKVFVDVKKDSLIVFTAIIDDKRENQSVYRNAVAKKDIDQGDWGFDVSETKVNGTAYQVLKLSTIDGKSVINEVFHRNDAAEENDATNQILIYFNKDKVADAKAWADKIKKMIQ